MLPGFPSTNASPTTAFPFGIVFANANTLTPAMKATPAKPIAAR
jgi:hypothetical protein